MLAVFFLSCVFLSSKVKNKISKARQRISWSGGVPRAEWVLFHDILEELEGQMPQSDEYWGYSCFPPDIKSVSTASGDLQKTFVDAFVDLGWWSSYRIIKCWNYWLELGPVIGVLAPPDLYRQLKFEELHPRVSQQLQAGDDDPPQSSDA
jgi:hypothetical protein